MEPFFADGERTATSTVDIGNDTTNIENILEDATPPNSPPTRVMLPDTSTTHKHINNNMSQCLTLPPIIKQRVPFIPINVGTLPIVQRNVDQNLLRNLSPKSTNSQGENRGHSSEPYYVDYARANHFPITDALILPIPSTPSNSITTKQVKREKLRMQSADDDSNTINDTHASMPIVNWYNNTSASNDFHISSDPADIAVDITSLEIASLYTQRASTLSSNATIGSIFG